MRARILQAKIPGVSIRRGLMAAVFGCLLGSGMSPLNAFAQAAGADETQPKQVALTQVQIDDLIAAEKDIHAAQGANEEDKPDPAADAKLEAVAKAHGFESLSQMTAVSFSVGLVMAGLDPETKTFVGVPAMLRKQIAQIHADTKMPAKDKAEALGELNAALQQGDAEPPLAANISIVKTNAEKLSAVVQSSD